MTGWAHLDDLERIDLDEGFTWRPVRRRFGITAFGVNAYSPGETGRVIEEHTERTYGHEEMYVVLRGRARFTLDGEERELGAGELVVVHDPGVRRGAVALTDDTVVLALGGRPGEPHETSPWEPMYYALPAMREERWDDAIRIHQEALAERPDNAPLLYNLACMEARGGRRLDALLHLKRAVELEPRWAEEAAKDSDFAVIRNEPGFPA
jgi:quercetin dioxygenase-like cupin family protein